MSRWIEAEYIKAVMLNDRLMQGNAEYELWKQKVDAQVKAMPSIDIIRCRECKHWKWIEWAKEYRCTLRNTAFNARADDFCSYGEREGE